MISAKLPERIGRLDELADNLWWSWHEQARQLFRALDYPLWKLSGHNPVKQLLEISPDTLLAAANDSAFLALYDAVITDFDSNVHDSTSWMAANYPSRLDGPVAYFSMEYALHNSLPIYAGGLGILAGDIAKEASDLGLPMVAVGFMYPQGYFHQHVSPEGWQEEIYRRLDFAEAPINRVLTPEGSDTVARIRLGDIEISIGVWLVRAGRTRIYLLDTNIEGNPARYKELSGRLYIAEPELRLQQEIVLGIGGVRVLRALGINPSIWHANEGHAAFMMLERVREEVATGTSFSEAVAGVQASTVFTTHTPVLAGHDIFSTQMIERCFADYWQSLGIDRETFLRLGQPDGSAARTFNMTVLALKAAGHRNAVSQLHGQVTRKMWHGLWPDVPEEQVPISSITNGVHLPTWAAPEVCRLLDKYLGADWLKEYDDAELWQRFDAIGDEELWVVHQRLKTKLVGAVRERMRGRWVEDNVPLGQMVAMGALLDPDALTIVFARRFTEYKRPTLIFRDIERLKRIVNDQFYPVQILFTGKSHPADLASKNILQQVYTRAAGREFQGRIVFIEDYDMHLAHYLNQGADVWLNIPRRRQEASGTSGMKAALNGALNLSVSDGWWRESYDGENGWVIGNPEPTTSHREEDEMDAEALYRLLEEEIVPLYYNRDRGGVPHAWIRRIKQSMRSIIPYFNTRRMLKEYTERLYLPAVAQSLKET